MKNTIDDTKQPVQGESRIEIDTSNTLESTDASNTKQDNTKSVNNELVIKIDESSDASKREANSVKGRYGRPVTWVYFQQGGAAIPDDGGPPLDYTPNRNSFIRLVFTILFIMLACTIIISVLVYTIEPLHDFFEDNGRYLCIPAVILMISLSYAMACLSCTRMFPCNIICLVLAVLGTSTICCFVTVRYDTTLLLLAVCATTAVVLMCLGLACTSFDFTSWLLYAVVIAGAVAVVSLTFALYTLITGHYMRLVHLGILCAGTIMGVIILTIELQMVLGGKAVELSEDDYALGAFLLYTSIVDIFLKLVQIMNIVGDF